MSAPPLGNNKPGVCSDTPFWLTVVLCNVVKYIYIILDSLAATSQTVLASVSDLWLTSSQQKDSCKMPSGLKTTLQILDFVFLKKTQKPEHCCSKKQNNHHPQNPWFFLPCSPSPLSRDKMEILAHTEMVRGGRGLAAGSSLPLPCQPKRGVSACILRNFADFRKGQKVYVTPSEFVLC